MINEIDAFLKYEEAFSLFPMFTPPVELRHLHLAPDQN